MPQTALETVLANAYPQDLEKLAVDLLSERGYDVEPTGTTGADGGLDARLADGDRVGTLHVSRTTKHLRSYFHSPAAIRFATDHIPDGKMSEEIWRAINTDGNEGVNEWASG